MFYQRIPIRELQVFVSVAVTLLILCGAACAESFRERGENFADEHQWDKAIEAYTQGLKINPNDKHLYHGRSIAYGALHRYDDAINDLKTYMKLAPEKTIGYYWLGAAYEQKGLPQVALDTYTKGLQMPGDRSKVDLLTARAKLYTKLGKLNQAIADYTSLSAMDSNDDNCYQRRGELYSRLGRYQEAVKDFTKVIELGMDIGSAVYESRATAWEKLGKNDLAQKDRAKAKELMKSHLVRPI